MGYVRGVADYGEDEGMSKETDSAVRDMFAAAALTGILAQSFTSSMTDEDFAEEAFNLADAMMAARAAPTES